MFIHERNIFDILILCNYHDHSENYISLYLGQQFHMKMKTNDIIIKFMIIICTIYTYFIEQPTSSDTR